jgi:hypothetical protein
VGLGRYKPVPTALMFDRAKNVKIRVERISVNPVAEISPETIAKILELLGRLSILIDRASAAELSIFNAYGETEELVDVLDQLQNTKERGVDAYTRLSGLMLKISGFQPSAPTVMVKMLTQSIEIAEATIDAGEATVKEAKSDWNIS